jgi:transposase
MFWGAFSCNHRSPLTALIGDPTSTRGGVTSHVILDCLKQNLPAIAQPHTIFVHDNASTFTAGIVKEWLRGWAGRNEVEIIKWPAYSPDLNPIENLWKLLKERICNRYPELADLPKSAYSKQLLCDASVELWDEFEEELFETLILSMTARLQAVVASRGWYTKY